MLVFLVLIFLMQTMDLPNITFPEFPTPPHHCLFGMVFLPFSHILFIFQYSDVTYKVFLNLFLFFLYNITFLPCAIIYLGACFLLH